MMRASKVRRAMAAAGEVAAAVGLATHDAVVLQDSNKVSLRLLPCDVLARVAPVAHQVAWFEVELARRLAEVGAPVATLVEPGVHEWDGFEVTLWTYYETVAEASPVDYAEALERLHAGMRQVDVPTPHFLDRVAEAQHLAASRDRSPDLADEDRELLGDALRDLSASVSERGGAEQVLHGEPHPGNVLATTSGPVFIDFETCCRGPVEFDVAHAPEEVGEQYSSLDRESLRLCRILVLAMVTAWRWDRDDRFPDGRRLGLEGLAQIRAALGRT